MIVVSILLTILGASWGLMQWQLNRVQRLLETQETLQLKIAQEQTALEQLQAQTWGRVAPRGGGREEVRGAAQVEGVPGGLAVDRARAACRAAFERVRALYDRAGDTLDGRTLSALSAQWEADQDQQAEEQGMLSARLDDLAQQVSDFAGQHEQQAAALQAQLEHLETQVGLLTKQYAIIAADYKALAALLARV